MPQISPLSWLALPLIFFFFFFFFLSCIWWMVFSFFSFSGKVCFDGSLGGLNNSWDW